jgi:MFS family permease
MARTEENSSVARNPNLLGDTWFFPGPVHVGDPPRLGEKIARPTKKDVPHFLNPFSLSTGGILLSYFDVGISMYLLLTPISYYMIATLDISATQYNAYTTLLSIPWSFKFAFGIITDCAPVNGYRRKNWLALGWLLFVGISFYMSTVDYPGFDLLTVSTFFMTCAYLLSDVCADSLAVERARYEHLVIKGSLQTSNYTIRSFGNVLGAVLGAILYNTPIWGWGLDIAQLFLVSAIYPLMGVIPAIWTLEELAATVPAPAVVETIESMWHTVKRSAVWIPISYIYFYGVFQIPNAAWTNFLIVGV